MKCPSCGNTILDDAIKCECGYDLTTHKAPLHKSFADMRARGLFLNSFRAYGMSLSTFLLLGAIYTAFSLGIELAVGEAWSIVSFIVVSIIFLMAQIVTYMALIVAAHKVSDGQEIGILESYALSFSLFWRFIWTSLLYILIVLGGTILLIIPGIIWGIRYVFAPYAVICEGISGKEALSRSETLTEGKFWSIFWREIVFGLLFFLMIAIAIFVLFFGIGGLISLIGISELNPMWEGVISTFGDIIGQGLFVIFNVLLFKSLREELLSSRAIASPERDTEGMQEVIDAWRQKAVGRNNIERH